MGKVFVTGGDGCLGAWVVRQLLDAGEDVVVYDVGANDSRHELVAEGRPRHFARVVGDITDADALRSAMAGADRVIHLAALQVPFCRDDPSLGAAVNVVGTVNVFEAALANDISPVVYASSVAVYGAPDDYGQEILPVDAARSPRTLYGAFKVANEQTAAVYAWDHGLGSVGLRPHTVYGPGRDQGLTSQPTVAIEHAVRRQPYQVQYGGTLDFQYAPDVARLFITASRSEPEGAQVLNVEGHVVPVADFIDQVALVTGFDGIGVGVDQLPLPHSVASDGLGELLSDVDPTPLRTAITETCRLFRLAGPQLTRGPVR